MSSRSLGLLMGTLAGLMLLGAVYFGIKLGRGEIGKSQVVDEKPKPPDAVAEGVPAVVGAPKVKLAVLVVFDQMRGDYPIRWKSLFGNGGFNRMATEGAHFTNCYYPYGVTSTGPGHASMLSGCSADKHGITNNEWFNRATGSKAYCAGSERYQFVPAKPVSLSSIVKAETKVAGCPEPLLSPTVADVLKKATNGQGKVFGVSLKDRSAVLPTGHKPDGAYWFDGRFVTSTYYRETVHPWVAELNRSKVMDQWFERPWTKLRPDLDYVQHSGPDEGLGESKVEGRGITFPHAMTGGKRDIAKEYYEMVANSPYGNELVLMIAKACIAAEGLGTRETPDLLTVSFSSNDIVGHAYGPDSQEVLDITLRSDLLLAELLSYLDERVGKGQYVVALTADHGIARLPELATALGEDAKRIAAVKLLDKAEKHLQAKFGPLNGSFDTPDDAKKETWIETILPPWIYVNERLCLAKGISKADVAKEYVAFLRQQPDIQNAYTAEELAKPESLDPIGKLMAKSFYPSRSGDLGVVLKPNYQVDAKITNTGVNHGSPHDYDRFVPLMIMGPGIKPGENGEAVVPQHAAPIFSHFLGIANPRDCEYVLPKTLIP